MYVITKLKLFRLQVVLAGVLKKMYVSNLPDVPSFVKLALRQSKIGKRQHSTSFFVYHGLDSTADTTRFLVSTKTGLKEKKGLFETIAIQVGSSDVTETEVQ